ncbi:MAG: acetylglutamate kinase [Candidatus Limnocylindria bacterium]
MSTASVTVKLGGAAGREDTALAALAARAEPGWVVVHGGGAEIGAWTERFGLTSTTIDGLRVTDAATLDVAVAVLRGLVNARIVASLAVAGVSALGLSGVDGDLMRAERFDERLGSVGRVSSVNRSLLDEIIAGGRVPVVAPIARAENADLLNVNADEAAGAIAAARGGRLILMTDVPAVMRGSEPLAAIGIDEAEALLADDSASGGMRPKLRAAIVAARAGCLVQIVNGTDPGAVRAALDGETTGTTVTAARAAGIG